MASEDWGEAQNCAFQGKDEAAGETIDPELDLSPRELVLLAFCSANFTALLELLDTMARFRLLRPPEICRLHERMSAAIDAAEPDSPPMLAIRVQTLLDEALADLLGRARRSG
jgi:hypothetical protein